MMTNRNKEVFKQKKLKKIFDSEARDPTGDNQTEFIKQCHHNMALPNISHLDFLQGNHGKLVMIKKSMVDEQIKSLSSILTEIN